MRGNTPMSAWSKCRELEELSRRHLQQHLLREMVFEGRFVRVEKGPMARDFQLTSGDYVANSDELHAWRIEHKCEYANTHRNFFLETFSNKSRGKLGWLFTNQADFLLYHFLRSGEVFLLNLPALRVWLYSHHKPGEPRAHRYREKQQTAYEQMNDTWGYCVSIAHVLDGIQVRTRMVPPLLIEAREAGLRAIGEAS
jgi:hypothetical protein